LEQRRVLQHHARGLLADHDRGRIGVAGGERRHDRGVGDAQAAIPRTRSRSSTTAFGSMPILQVPTG
jgi:hypothetical protein